MRKAYLGIPLGLGVDGWHDIVCCRKKNSISLHYAQLELLSVIFTIIFVFLDDWNPDTLSARTQALFLLGSLLSDRSAADSVWRQLREKPAGPFFSLLLQCLESEASGNAIYK